MRDKVFSYSLPLNNSHSSRQLLVTIPRHAVKLSRDVPPDKLDQVGKYQLEHPFSLIVHVDRSLLKLNEAHTTSHDINRFPQSQKSPSSFGTVNSSINDLDSLAEDAPTASKRPRLMPTNFVPGVHGCVGRDGHWYQWTEAIPGEDAMVTVLPYIYIDGWTTVEKL